MKRCFAVGFVLALGALGAIAPEASANGFDQEVSVPFGGSVLNGCIVTPVAVPGLLSLDENDPKTLVSTSSGGLTVICKGEFTVTPGTPVETTLAALPQFGDIASSTSSVKVSDGVALEELTLVPGIIHDIDVDMSVSSANDIVAGAYTFNVPVRVVCP